MPTRAGHTSSLCFSLSRRAHRLFKVAFVIVIVLILALLL